MGLNDWAAAISIAEAATSSAVTHAIAMRASWRQRDELAGFEDKGQVSVVVQGDLESARSETEEATRLNRAVTLFYTTYFYLIQESREFPIFARSVAGGLLLSSQEDVVSAVTQVVGNLRFFAHLLP
jgi:hypothetical protein